MTPIGAKPEEESPPSQSPEVSIKSRHKPGLFTPGWYINAPYAKISHQLELVGEYVKSAPLASDCKAKTGNPAGNLG